MALVLTDLSQGFLDMANNPPPSAAEAAKKAADIYEAYAQKATGGGFPPTLTGSEKERMKVALQGAFSAVPSAAPVAASAWLQGLTAFWLTPPVVFGAGAVSGAVPPLNTVVACLAGISAPAPSAEAPTTQVATCLHTATLQVQVFIPPSTTVNLV